MPLIQSKKYKTEQFITVEAWDKFQETGRARKFIVIDDGDIQDTVIKTPVSFTDFNEVEKEPAKFATITKAEIKVELDALGIDYSEKDNKETLYNKLINL